jgi:hydroxypyruvate isomerase
LIGRRDMLAISAGALGTAFLPHAESGLEVAADRVRQSVSRWPFAGIPLETFCRAAKAMGLAGIDLLQPAEWEVVRGFGLVPSMGYPADRPDFISTGFNDPRNHAQLLGEWHRLSHFGLRPLPALLAGDVLVDDAGDEQASVGR